jgi:PKD repeat protein
VSRHKATAGTLAQSHIRMYIKDLLLKVHAHGRGIRNKPFSSLPVILSVILTLTAISCGGGSSNPSSQVPVANPGGPYLGNVNQALAFNGSGSSAPSGKSLVSFVWNFGDGGSAMGASVSHTYTVAGNFTATLTVTDNAGATATGSVAVQIITAPVAHPGGPYTGKVGVAVSFDGSASTAPPGQALGFTWNFGDGSTASGATPTHTYATAGTFNVSLTVTDDTAGTSTGTTTATITAGPGPSVQAASPSTFFAIGPSAGASTQFAYTLRSSPGSPSALSIETFDTTAGNLLESGLTAPALDSNFVPSGMITDPSRNFLYVYGGNSVLTFSISSDTGALTPSGTTATNGSNNIADNQLLIFNPNGKFAFFITQEQNGADTAAPGSITRFSVDPNTGTLGAIETISAQVQNPQAAAIEPSGKFLYVSGAAPEIAIFTVATGTAALNPVSRSPVQIESGISATSIAIDSTGRFIYAAGRNSATNSGALCVFTINAETGELAQSSSTLSLGAGIADSTSLALSPSANFGWVSAISHPTGAAVHQFTQLSLRAPSAAVYQSVQLFQWDSRTGAPTVGNSVIESDLAANQFAFRVFNLALFTPNQVSSTGDVKTPSAGFLFFANSPGDPVYAVELNSNTGSFPWIADSKTSSGH